MNHLLRAARIVPYGGGRAEGPVAVNDTGLIVASGGTADFDILGNDQRVGDAQVRLVGGPTAPITAQSIVNDRLQITAGTVASNTAWSQTYEVETQFGISQAVASGTVQAVVTTASIIGQWELNTLNLGVFPPTVGTVSGTATGLVQFAQPTIPSGGAGGVAMSGQQGFLSIDDPAAPGTVGVFQKQAFGVSFYAQVGALAAAGGAATTAFTDGSNWSDGSAWTDSGASGGGSALQLVHKDRFDPNGSTPGGLAIEYANFGGVNRLDPYMRDAGGTVRRFTAPAGIERDIGLNQSFLVTFTYDPAPASGGKCKLYLRKQGGATALVGDGLTDESQVTTGFLQNVETWVLGTYNQSSGGMHGALQRLVFWSGAPTLTQLNTLSAPANNITITYPQATPPPVINTDPLPLALSATETTKTINPTLTASNAAAATVTVGTHTGSFLVTVAGQIIDVDRQVGNNAAVTGSIPYTLTTPAGSDSGTISVNIAAVVTGTVTPFPFKTYRTSDYRPSPVVKYNRPVYNASSPRSGAVIDPNSGLPVFAVLPTMNVQLLRADGSGSGYYRPRIAKHHISENPVAWSAQSKYLWIGQVHEAFAQSGQTWPGGGVFIRSSDWKIYRFGCPLGTDCWWDDVDPDKLWRVETNGQYKSLNVTTGLVQDEFKVNGYTYTIGGSLVNEASSYGRFMVNGAHARAVTRQSDGRKVVIKVHLRSIGGVGPGVVSVLTYPTTTTGTNPVHTVHGQSHHVDGVLYYLTPNGKYVVTVLAPGDNISTFTFPTPNSTSSPPQATMESAWRTTCQAGVGSGVAIKHVCVGQVNGQDIVTGTGSNGDFTMHNIDTDTSRVIANVPDSSNPGSTSCSLAWQDTFNKYGDPTDGPSGDADSGVDTGTSLIGPRYAVFAKSTTSSLESVGLAAGGIWAFRLGPADFDGGATASNAKCRYLCHPLTDHKNYFNSNPDDDQQVDANISPDGRFVVFVSKYNYASNSTADDEATPYVIELPEGWFSNVNSSTP